MEQFLFFLNIFSLVSEGFFQLFFSSRFTGKKVRAYYYLLYVLFLYISFRIETKLGKNGFSLVSQLLSLYAANYFLLHNSFSVSAITTILALYITQLSFGFINSIELLFFPMALGNTILLQILTVMAVAAAVGICLCCYLLISKDLLIGKSQEPYASMLLPQVLFFFAVELYIFYTAYGNVLTVPYPMELGRQLSLLILQFLGLGALISTLYAYRRTCDSFRDKAALASLKQEIHAQKIYVDEAQMRYEKTKAFRHDIRNHLSVLDGLLKFGYLQKAQDYLQGLETVTDQLSFPCHTGNPVIDVVLGNKLELAKAYGIKVEVMLTLSKPCNVDDLDFCVIFTNALDNAIRASMKVVGSPIIQIAGERQGDFYMLEFENACLAEPFYKMGTGLANIEAVADKYAGAITIEKSHGIFRLNVLLNISAQSEDSLKQTY